MRELIAPWRTGGRTIYIQWSDEPSYDDPLIGVMDTPELARAVVEAHEYVRANAPEVYES